MCGFVGMVAPPDQTSVAAEIHTALMCIQHRGQDSAGIATMDDRGATFHMRRGLGTASQALDRRDLDALAGPIGVGHVRYPTIGRGRLEDAQPFFYRQPGILMAHNGNITNAEALRRELIERGSIFQSSSDSECIIHLMARSLQRTIPERMKDALRRVEGAFSIVAMTRTKLIGVRDPLGVRPLMLGKIGDGWALSSETCALDIIGADFVREIKPGEMVVITEGGVESFKPFTRPFSTLRL